MQFLGYIPLAFRFMWLALVSVLCCFSTGRLAARGRLSLSALRQEEGRKLVCSAPPALVLEGLCAELLFVAWYLDMA